VIVRYATAESFTNEFVVLLLGHKVARHPGVIGRAMRAG
jgi:hypothetical protein